MARGCPRDKMPDEEHPWIKLKGYKSIIYLNKTSPEDRGGGGRGEKGGEKGEGRTDLVLDALKGRVVHGDQAATAPSSS